MSKDPTFLAEQELGRINAFFPILPQIGNLWAASRPWESMKIALNLHITTLTAALVKELQLGGAECIVCAADPGTTDSATVKLLRSYGVTVYTGRAMRDRHKQVLGHDPHLLVDAGFKLIKKAAQVASKGGHQPIGAIEISRTGISALRAHGDLPFPVININDGRLKNAVENRHGVGEAVWSAVSQLTGMHLSGRRVAVVGYGPVGKGLATNAKAAGMTVEVVESDSVRRLFAHYDGFPTPILSAALKHVGLLVTATGTPNVITLKKLKGARSGLVLFNAGHGGNEIDCDSIRNGATRIDNVADQVVTYHTDDNHTLTILGDGHPLNIVLNSGSPEPVLLHFSVIGLTLEWLAKQKEALPPGEQIVPETIESRSAELALKALDVAGS